MDDANEDDDLIPPDVRRPQRLLDSRRQADGELSDSDDEGEGDRRDHASHREVALDVAARFGTATGIMQAGSTHGVGPTVTKKRIQGLGPSSGIARPSADMKEIMKASGEYVSDDDVEAPLSQSVRAKSKKAASPPSAVTNPTATATVDADDSMDVDPPADKVAEAAGEAAPSSAS